MTPLIYAPIIEGHGEEEALRVLINSVLAAIESDVYPTIVAPYRVPWGTLVHVDGELERYAARAIRDGGPMAKLIVLLDADDRCPAELGPELLNPNPPKGYGAGVDTGDDGYGKANRPGRIPTDDVEGSARWPRWRQGGVARWRKYAKSARPDARSDTRGLGWHESAGQPARMVRSQTGRASTARRTSWTGW